MYGTASYTPKGFPSNTPLKYSEPTDVLTDLDREHSKSETQKLREDDDLPPLRKNNSGNCKNRSSEESRSTMVSDLIVAAKRDITKLFRQSEYFVMVEKYKKKRK